MSEIFQTEVVQKIETHFLSNIFFKSCLLGDNVEKNGRTGQDIGDNTILRMRFTS